MQTVKMVEAHECNSYRAEDTDEVIFTRQGCDDGANFTLGISVTEIRDAQENGRDIVTNVEKDIWLYVDICTLDDIVEELDSAEEEEEEIDETDDPNYHW